MTRFEGVLTALVTPFKQGEIDFKSLKKLIHHQLDSGIQGFIVSGSTGEAATLKLEEKIKTLQFVIGEVSKKVPVMVGSGTYNTRETCELIQAFDKSKPDGHLLVTPYYNKPPQRGLEQHFLKAAESTELPILLYNVPGRTACAISVETVSHLARITQNIVGIKEAAGDITVIKELKEKCPEDFQITSGDDPTFLEAIAIGAVGVISVVSHIIPKLCVEYAKKAKENRADSQKIKEMSRKILNISETIFCESNPIPVKWALKEMGLIESDEVRLPLVTLDPKFYEKMRGAMREVVAL